jgi:DNA-directed RNA polymerase specialized sigma24 family protein
MEDPLDNRVREIINNADWGVIGKALVAFAEYRVQNYSWRSGSNQVLPLGKTPEDIAQEVILKTISGERTFDPEKGELLPWSKDQVKSIVDALARSAAHRKEVRLEDINRDNDVHPPTSSQRELVSLEPSPEQHLINSERAGIIKSRLEKLVSLAAEDPALEKLMEALMDGCPLKPRFLAEHLGISILETYNLVRRLRRLALSKVSDEDA